MLDHKDEEKQALERYLDKHKRKKWSSLSAESEKNSDQGILVYLALVVFFFISVCIAIFLSGEPLEVAFGQREQVLPKDGTPSHTAVILVLMLFLFSVVFCVVLIYVIRKQNRKKGKILLEKINNQLKQNQDSR